ERGSKAGPTSASRKPAVTVAIATAMPPRSKSGRETVACLEVRFSRTLMSEALRVRSRLKRVTFSARSRCESTRGRLVKPNCSLQVARKNEELMRTSPMNRRCKVEPTTVGKSGFGLADVRLGDIEELVERAAGGLGDLDIQAHVAGGIGHNGR